MGRGWRLLGALLALLAASLLLLAQLGPQLGRLSDVLRPPPPQLEGTGAAAAAAAATARAGGAGSLGVGRAGAGAASGKEAAAVAADAAGTAGSVAAAAPAARKNCTIFTLWNYPHGAPPFVQLNVESWSRHSHGLCDGPVLVNDTNVRKYVPDMPEEFWRLPYDAAKSDMIRYALLYHHGGIYMDTDFLVVKDLSDLIARLPDHDLISYETEGQSCKQKASFSSNFMGGRKGSAVHGAIWEAQKRALCTHCQPEEMPLEKVCCLDDPGVICHIPWTQLGEGISHRVLRDFLKGRDYRPDLRLFCYGGQESFVPRNVDTVLTKKPQIEAGLKHWSSIGEMMPMDRIAYHLFNSLVGMRDMSRTQLFDTSTVIGTLYTKSFSGTAQER